MFNVKGHPGRPNSDGSWERFRIACILGDRLLTPPNCVSMNQAILDHIDTGKPYVRLHRMRYLESRR